MRCTEVLFGSTVLRGFLDLNKARASPAEDHKAAKDKASALQKLCLDVLRIANMRASQAAKCFLCKYFVFAAYCVLVWVEHERPLTATTRLGFPHS